MATPNQPQNTRALTTVSREIQCDVGHRIPMHKSACSNVHGHRYRIIATVEGPVVRNNQISDDGMVTDFGDLKGLMMSEIHQVIDHAFMIWKDDQPLRSFLEAEGYRLLVMDHPPTAENLSEWCYRRLESAIRKSFPPSIRLREMAIWETPNCCARFRVTLDEDPTA